jgi:hypothetical protein
MPSAGIEPAIPVSHRPQTLALDRSGTGTGFIRALCPTWFMLFCISSQTVFDGFSNCDVPRYSVFSRCPLSPRSFFSSSSAASSRAPSVWQTKLHTTNPFSYFLGAFAKLRKVTISFMSVCPHGTTRLSLDGFWLNLIFEIFSKICHENSTFIKIRQK